MEQKQIGKIKETMINPIFNHFKKRNVMENKLEIVPPTGYKIVIKNNKAHFELIEKRICSWRELKNIEGYQISKHGNKKFVNVQPTFCNRHTFKDEELLKKSIAIAKLGYILRELNEDWESLDFYLYRDGDKVLIDESLCSTDYHFLRFKDEETANYFMSIPEFENLARWYFELDTKK